MTKAGVAKDMGIIGIEEVLLHCPVRGALGAKALAKDELTITEEARLVDFLRFLIEDRSYPPDCIRVEVVTIKNLGTGGRNKLRADVIVSDCPWSDIEGMDKKQQLDHAVLVAEIKRDAAQKSKGVSINWNRPCACYLAWTPLVSIGMTKTGFCSPNRCRNTRK